MTFLLLFLGVSVAGGTVLGLGMYTWDRFQERQKTQE